MIIPRAVVIAVLRQRGHHSRADFVARELPEQIDSNKHGGLLITLNIDPAALAELAGSDSA
jgi:hypothetical protein